MTREAAITVRVPLELKRRLAARAKRERRSLSAQVLHELERATAGEPAAPAKPARSVLGMFSGRRLPTAGEIAEVRALLWRRLGDRDA